MGQQRFRDAQDGEEGATTNGGARGSDDERDETGGVDCAIEQAEDVQEVLRKLLGGHLPSACGFWT